MPADNDFLINELRIRRFRYQPSWASRFGYTVPASSNVHTEVLRNVFQDFAWPLSDPARPEDTLVADERALDSVYVCEAIRESAAVGRYVRIDELRACYAPASAPKRSGSTA